MALVREPQETVPPDPGLYEGFVKAVLADDGLTDLARHVSLLTGTSVIIENVDRTLLGKWYADGASERSITGYLEIVDANDPMVDGPPMMRTSCLPTEGQDDPIWVVVAPVTMSNQVLARVICMGATPPSGADYAVLRNAALTLGVFLVARYRSSPAAGWGRVIGKLIQGDPSYWANVPSERQECQFSVFAVLPVAREGVDDASTANSLMGAVASVGEQCGIRAFAAADGGGVGAILLIPRKADAKSASREFGQELLRRSGLPVGAAVVGIGQATSQIASLPECLSQARYAAQIAMQEKWTDSVVSYEEIGAYKLLFGIKNPNVLWKFYEDTLGKVAEYDRKNSAQLLETIEAFFRCNGSVVEMARSLFVHRNTVLYRMQRIESVTGFDLRNAWKRFDLQLALMISHVLTDNHH